ncbi:FAD dependent oxidoreductase [Pseudomonas aeruginosa]|nr:FAD dependent oxidoreductase [Pseudomonas aeruginosa]
MFLQSNEHVGTYYAAVNPELIQPRQALEGDLDCEVLVVGAGFSGLHTALRLVEGGRQVCVIEASRIAWAASGRNGGQALPGWSSDLPPLEADLGYEGARRLWDGMLWAAGEMRELPQRHGFDCDYRVGHLWTAILPRRVGLLYDWQAEANRRWGYEGLRFVAKDELPEWIASERYLAGLYDPHAAHLNPLKLAFGLAAAIERAGGRIHERTRALNYREEGDGYRVRTEHGEIRCAALVLACNAYIDGLDSELSQRMLPVGTYQVATEPLGEERAKSLLPRNCCVTDNQFVLDYFRLTPDHRLLFGGGCTYLGGMPSDIRAATRPYLERVFPQLRGVALEYAWGGHIDCSMRRTPDIGRQGNRYWLQGYSGHGVLPSLAAARAATRCSATTRPWRYTSACAIRSFPAASASPRRWKPWAKRITVCATCSERARSRDERSSRRSGGDRQPGARIAQAQGHHPAGTGRRHSPFGGLRLPGRARPFAAGGGRPGRHQPGARGAGDLLLLLAEDPGLALGDPPGRASDPGLRSWRQRQPGIAASRRRLLHARNLP